MTNLEYIRTLSAEEVADFSRSHRSMEQEGGMTNADAIRRMTDEQLFLFLSAWELGDIDYGVAFCDLCEESKKAGGKGNTLGLDCDGCKEHWIKRDAEEYGGLLYGERWRANYETKPTTEKNEKPVL